MELHDDSLVLTNIEMKINQDKSGRFKDESVNFLANQQRQVKAKMESGVSPNDFQKLTEIKNAIDCASDVIKKLWESKHNYVGKNHMLNYSK